ncbi:MAG: hypothetical protein RBT34_09705 [Anaerolineaceae bacterium]|jgi:hypothetical protein|nr:hypothetical protein [Anaerolineaceae bacterium]
MNENETLQEKLQVQERKKNRMGKGIVIGAVILILLVCAGAGVFKLRDWAAAQGEIAIATAAVWEAEQAAKTATTEANAPKPGYEDPAEAVKLSVTQWYTYDYTGEFEDWAEKMCEFTTKYACQKEVYNIGGENWKNNVVPKQMQSVVDITPVRMIWEHSYYDENEGHNLDTQIWEYKLVGSVHPEKEFTRYVMVADSGAGWLMVHDLWDEEAAQLLQEISATAIPEEPTT